MQQSLWGEEFKVEHSDTKKILKKINSSKSYSVEKALKSKTLSIDDKLKIIYENVHRILGTYKGQTTVLRSALDVSNYLDVAVKNNIIAIDTETNNSLDPLTCKLMGVCIYTQGMKNAYIPVNHVNRYTGERLDNQLTEEEICELFHKVDNTFTISHNGKFDYEVLKCTTGWEMRLDYDTAIGAKLLNENEEAKLKVQYINKIDPSIEKYSIEGLFKGIEYAVVDPEIFALYAATDSYMTYKLFMYQMEQFQNEPKLFHLFNEVEMPIVKISANMELRGICVDAEYSKRLSVKYNSYLEEIDKKLRKELEQYKDVIFNWRNSVEANQHKTVNGKIQKSKNEQLKDPIELSSSTQLSILLYDILKVPTIDKKNPRGTGAEILEQIDLPLCKLLIEQKTISKLLDAFIDTLPNKVSPRDGRLHSHFNQLGTKTGRFSSTEPNLQQIPSKNKEVRMIFKAQPGYTLVGADFSAQEPRILSAYSKDEKMLKAFADNKDIYATIGSGIFKNDYWDNMEHYEDGTPNVEGDKRRSRCKKLILGMTYGMGAKKMAENMGVSLDEGKKIIKDFSIGFPTVQKWIEKTERDASVLGYVEDYAGRKRHLPDLLLPEFEVVDNNLKNAFNPLLYVVKSTNTNSELVSKYRTLWYNCKSFKEKEALKEQAKKENVEITDNGGFISRAKRQCVNARIQGGAATMTKKAMILIENDKEINDLGFKLLIGVHDELIGECPKENAEKASERLSYLMRTCVPELPVVFKCDAEIEEHWYENKYSYSIQKEMKNMIAEGLSEDDALYELCIKHPESTEDKIREYLKVS